MSDPIEGFLGKSINGKKSRMPAKLDYIQSATGLFLALFMWTHLMLVASILISPEFMNKLSRMFEGSMIFAEPKPILVSILALGIFIIFITHAVLAMRKLPINFRQYQIYRTHMGMMKHDETSMWFVQAVTGVIM
ncbi:MAG: hypothetical protein RL154_1658, partial [Pseudomonadota bacterium]